MTHTVQVLSSKGDRHYTVTLDDRGRAVSCDPTCKGWEHRQACRHLADAERMHSEQQARDRKKEKA